MARYTGAKTKLMRKIGQDLGLKSNPLKAAKRINVPPGMHGRKGKKKISEYGIQLLEKQKARTIYGILEKQFHNYYVKAAGHSEATGSALLSLLERRLDNVVYRLGLAPTRAAARQLVSHGNVKVNDKKVSIPSYQVKVDDIVTLSQNATNIPYISELLKDKDHSIPQWLSRKAAAGKVVRLPERDDVTEDISEQLIVEYYSR